MSLSSQKTVLSGTGTTTRNCCGTARQKTEPSSLGYTETTPEQDDLIVTIDRSADWFDPRAGSTSPDLSSATLIRYDSA